MPLPLTAGRSPAAGAGPKQANTKKDGNKILRGEPGQALHAACSVVLAQTPLRSPGR
jgi:hypothetical protein